MGLELKDCLKFTFDHFYLTVDIPSYAVFI